MAGLPTGPKVVKMVVVNEFDLLTYKWPGNVRDLQNIFEWPLILNPNGPLKFDIVRITVQADNIFDHEFESHRVSIKNSGTKIRQ
jgi:DNA-binding NtrC family response regulator